MRIISVPQAASILHVHPATIRKLIASGKLKGFRVGRSYKIIRSDFKAFLDQAILDCRKDNKSKTLKDYIQKI